MADADVSEADALSRLEAALDRIAKHRPAPPRDSAPAVDTAEISARLEALIGQLRQALPGEA